jgi:hypothetical protein
MYSFTDRGGEQLTLRPEGTASFARALISEGLSQDLPLKYFYHGPMFRYERPQKGRMRQFHQTGVELLGAARVRLVDVPCVEPRGPVAPLLPDRRRRDRLPVAGADEVQQHRARHASDRLVLLPVVGDEPEEVEHLALVDGMARGDAPLDDTFTMMDMRSLG